MAEVVGPEGLGFDDTVSELLERFKDDVEAVRELSRSQSEIWNRIPYYALHAQGKGGYNDSFYGAYADGLWVLHDSLGLYGYYRAAVDLDNGEIVSLNDPQKPASDADILTMLSTKFRELHAQPHLDYLVGRAEEPFPYYGDDLPEDELAAWREEQEAKLGVWHASEAERFGVTEIYTRQRIITAEEMSERDAASIAADMTGSY
ncbi:MAG: hypothetical protein R3313_03250 [Candidatus Saccharimonadales bacterium]|nr:hypothetical protein [Candidatus Saccharimonadales bacterium]